MVSQSLLWSRCRNFHVQCEGARGIGGCWELEAVFLGMVMVQKQPGRQRGSRQMRW